MRGVPPRAALLLAAFVGLFHPEVRAFGLSQLHSLQLEKLKPIAALPAHIAGSFESLSACEQAASGEYYVFDRRAHSVYVVAPGREHARKLIDIGAEPGRVLAPTAFRLARDGSFVVADAPGSVPRIQMFTVSGSSLGAFYLPTRSAPRIALGNLVLSGVAAIEYTGRSVYLSQPENGALIVEYSADGRALRSFGELRRTAHESEPDVHLALNSGVVLATPDGGFYFVFLAGVPQFRKYDPKGSLVFERHIEGREMDRFIQNLPSSWKRRRTEAGEIPLVLPSVYAAAVDGAGNLWVSLPVGVTYVYDTAGDKRRAVEFHAAGSISPTGLSFTPKGRLLVAPGCYAFAV